MKKYVSLYPSWINTNDEKSANKIIKELMAEKSVKMDGKRIILFNQ